MEAWVDGNKVLGIYNFKWYTDAIYGVDYVELQHVYYNRPPSNDATYMDNIVVSDSYIGPVGSIGETPPPPAQDLRILP